MLFFIKLISSFFTFQPGAPKKKSAKAAKPRGSKSSKGSKGNKGKKKKGASGSKKTSRKGSATTVQTREVDMMDPAAMFNLYYIAHGPVEALELRGFGWAAAPKKKGKKGKKGKK